MPTPREDRRRRRSAPLIWRASLLAIAVLAAGCSSESGEKQPVVPVQTATAERVTIRQVVTAEAVLFPVNESALTPKISAPVRQFFVNRGSKVRRGQLLAILENRDLSAVEIENKGAYEQAQANYQTRMKGSLPQEVEKAKLDVEQAKQALDAQQKLYDSRENLYKEGALPRKELDLAAVALVQARAQYDLAEKHLKALQAGGEQQQVRAASGELEAAQGKYMGSAAQLSYSRIVSPINGVVTDRPLYPGEMAAAGTPLITVMDLSKVIAKAHLPQQQASTLRAGDTATLTAPGVADAVPAQVTLVSPAVDPNSTTIEVWVEAANPRQLLRPGTTVEVSIVAQQVPDAVVVPAASVLTSPQGETSVMIVGSDGRAHQQSVHLGIRNDSQVQVVSGVNPGQQVVTTGAYGLPDKTKVKVEPPAAQPPPPQAGETR